MAVVVARRFNSNHDEGGRATPSHLTHDNAGSIPIVASFHVLLVILSHTELRFEVNFESL